MHLASFSLQLQFSINSINWHPMNLLIWLWRCSSWAVFQAHGSKVTKKHHTEGSERQGKRSLFFSIYALQQPFSHKTATTKILLLTSEAFLWSPSVHQPEIRVLKPKHNFQISAASSSDLKNSEVNVFWNNNKKLSWTKKEININVIIVLSNLPVKLSIKTRKNVSSNPQTCFCCNSLQVRLSGKHLIFFFLNEHSTWFSCYA